MTEPMPMWVVYDHPTDDPLHFVVRRWEITAGQARPTTHVERFTAIEAARNSLADRGLTVIPPLAWDDPVIVETWL